VTWPWWVLVLALVWLVAVVAGLALCMAAGRADQAAELDHERKENAA
jgi:hypothetical protein